MLFGNTPLIILNFLSIIFSISFISEMLAVLYSLFLKKVSFSEEFTTPLKVSQTK